MVELWLIIFDVLFQFCVCDSAIKTKFEKHTQKGLDIMSKVRELLQSVSEAARVTRQVLTPFQSY